MYKFEALDLKMLRKIFYWCVVAIVIGGFSGLASTLFLHSVDWAISIRKAYPWLILFLPFVGFLTALFYRYYGKEVERGNNLIIDEIHEPKKVIPFRIVPMIFLGTVSSHLFGASVGREGAGVQMGAGIADQCSKYLGNFSLNRKLFLMMGMSAGFASVFGAPIAGTIFGLEVLFIGTLVYDALLPCLVAAISAFYTTIILGVVHPPYFYMESANLSFGGFFSAIVAGILFGYTAKLFVYSLLKVKTLYKNYVLNNLYHLIIGGLILVVSYYVVGSDRYHSLGQEIIYASFTQHVYPWDFFGKLFMTVVSVGSGFKGGEVMSLFYIGSTLGNALAWILPLDYPILAALGFVSVFAGAANVPITSVLLAFELFGPGIGAYAALAVVASYLFSGGSGIYYSQRNSFNKNI